MIPATSDGGAVPVRSISFGRDGHTRFINRHRNERHGNYLRDNTNRLLDKLLAEGEQAVPYV
jgi:hypothetical protein